MFNPPYDSPLEELFAWHFTKYLNDSVTVFKQYNVDTIKGRFRIDFVLELLNYKIGFECDGREFHDPSRDEWRDALILGTNQIKKIYRIRGTDIYNHIEDILYIISKKDAAIFNKRGLLNIKNLASEYIKNIKLDGKSRFIIKYSNHDKAIPNVDFIDLEIHSFKEGSSHRDFLKRIFLFAQKSNKKNLNEIIKDFRS